jgi:hypothetical protein
MRSPSSTGIIRFGPCFHVKATILAELFQYNLALFALTRLNLLTEGFTEGFARKV